MNFLTKLKPNSLGKKILILTGGTAFAQFYSIIISPIITRVYTPEEYGIASLYAACLTFLTFGSLKYEIAIPLPKSEKKAMNLLILSLILVASFSILLLFSLSIFGNSFLEFLSLEELIPYKFLIPLGVFLAGIFNILAQWGYREKSYSRISKATVTQSLFGNTSIMIFGISGFGATGFVIGRILSMSFGSVTLAKPLIQSFLKKNPKTSVVEIKWVAKRYKDFPLYLTPSSVLTIFSIQVPIIFLSILYDAQTVGFYSLATTIVMLPMKLIGDAFGNVFYSEAAKIGKFNSLEIKTLSNAMLKKLSLLSILPVLVLIIAGPWLFTVVFGSQWYVAGVYSRILGVLLFFRLVFTPISRVFEIFEKQKLKLIINIFKAILVVASFTLSMLLDLSSYMTISLYCLAMIIMNLITYFIAQSIINSRVNNH